MEWILILWVTVQSFRGEPATAMTTAGFTNEEACRAAGKAVVAVATLQRDSAVYVCTARG
jgi:hypothetical protein